MSGLVTQQPPRCEIDGSPVSSLFPKEFEQTEKNRSQGLKDFEQNPGALSYSSQSEAQKKNKKHEKEEAMQDGTGTRVKKNDNKRNYSRRSSSREEERRKAKKSKAASNVKVDDDDDVDEDLK